MRSALSSIFGSDRGPCTKRLDEAVCYILKGNPLLCQRFDPEIGLREMGQMPSSYRNSSAAAT